MAKKTAHLILPLFLFVLIFNLQLMAQVPAADSVNNPVNYAEGLYHGAIGKQSKLYNGPEYMFYDRHIKGNPYFPDDTLGFKTGSVIYDGLEYRNVKMRYDILRDAIDVLHYDKYSQFSLLSDHVSAFSVSGMQFTRLIADSLDKTNSFNIKTGFYQQLYNGKIKLYAKREKSLQNINDFNGKDQNYFFFRTVYILNEGNKYYRIANYNSLIDLLKDKKKELNQYVKDSGINFRKNQEQGMAAVASYYDHLKN